MPLRFIGPGPNGTPAVNLGLRQPGLTILAAASTTTTTNPFDTDGTFDAGPTFDS